MSTHQLIWGLLVPKTTLWCCLRWRRWSEQTYPSWWTSRWSWRSRFLWPWTDRWRLCGLGSLWAFWPEPPRLLPQEPRSHYGPPPAVCGYHRSTGCSPQRGCPQCTGADIWLLGEDTDIWALMDEDSKKDIMTSSAVPGHGLLPHFCISAGRPEHWTVTELLAQVLLLILRPPPQVTEHIPHRPHELHFADHIATRNHVSFKWSFKIGINRIIISVIQTSYIVV